MITMIINVIKCWNNNNNYEREKRKNQIDYDLPENTKK